MGELSAPQLRVAGFADSWEVYKIGSLVSFLRHNSLARAALTTEATGIQNVHYGDILVRFGNVLDPLVDEIPFVRDVSRSGLGDRLRDGDVVFADAAEDETVGKCCEIRNVYESLIVPGLHTISVRPNREFGEGFLGHGLNAKAFHDQLVPLMQGSKVSSISASTLASCTVSFPSVQEQRQVGSLLSQLDSSIDQHKRKLEQLEQTKVALMQRMFPRGDADEPELRLEGFTGAWESRNWGSLMSVLRHNSLARVDLTTEDTGVRNVHYGDVLVKFRSILNPNVDDIPFVRSTTSSKLGDLLQDGDVIFADAAEDETVGKCCELRHTEGNAIVPGLHTIPIRPTIQFAEGFLGYALNAEPFHDQLIPLMQGSKISSISVSALSRCELSFPSLAEQQAIGAIFSSLDELISAERHYIYKLQQVESGLLQNMFI